MDRIELNGTVYRVEVNWNAIVAYLEASGRDDVQELMSLARIKPSEMAGLLAAAINEGERLDGRECSLSADEVGRMAGIATMAEFVKIFTRQVSPKGSAEEEKKA